MRGEIHGKTRKTEMARERGDCVSDLSLRDVRDDVV